jgi:hypothetical protein
LYKQEAGKGALNTDSTVVRSVKPDVARDTTLLVGTVSPGTYTLEIISMGQETLFLNRAAQQIFGNIRVEEGKVSDLGRIVLAPVNDLVLSGRSAQVTSNVDLVKKYSPENASILSRPVESGWLSARSREDHAETYALRNPSWADAPVALKSGQIVAVSRFGSLLTRNDSGLWHAINSGGLDSFHAVIPVLDGVDGSNALAVAVGELNTIARLDEFDKLTVLDAGDLPAGNILNIAGNATVGWFVAHRQRDKIVVYHSKYLERGTWQAVRTENITHSFWPYQPSFWMWSSDAGFFYAVNDGRILFYEFATQSWSERHVPKNHRLAAVAPNGKNISVLSSAGGEVLTSHAQVYVTFDGGVNWELINLPLPAKYFAPSIVDDTTLLVAGKGKASSNELQISKDRGKTWRIVNIQFNPLSKIVPLGNKGLLAIKSENFKSEVSIYHSMDSGNTWQQEYSNHVKAAAK